MSEIDAYKKSLRHQHTWTELCAELEWCPECGATRPTTESDRSPVAT